MLQYAKRFILFTDVTRSVRRTVCKKLMSLENIEILWNSEVKEIQGQDMVDHILVYNNKEKSEQQFPVDGIFIAVGVEPNTQIV